MKVKFLAEGNNVNLWWGFKLMTIRLRVRHESDTLPIVPSVPVLLLLNVFSPVSVTF